MAQDSDRYKKLPEPVKLEDTRPELDTRPVPDPNGAIDSETLFMLRYAG